MSLAVAVAVCCASCVKRVETEEDHTSKIAGGTVLSRGGGPGNRIGGPVEVQLTFRDGSPPCTMYGQVQDARDSAHRWVWLEPGEGCPGWLSGRWWAELASGGSGWYVQNISTKPVAGAP